MDKDTKNIITDIDHAKTEKGRLAKVRARFWQTLRKAASHIPFIEDVIAAYFCAMDPATPRRVRGILLAALAYFVLPFDAIPDILAVIGFSDDVAVLTIAIAAVRTHIKQEHFLAAQNALKNMGNAASHDNVHQQSDTDKSKHNT